MDFKTPGIYIREVEVSPPPRVRLDITGCVGQAERGPLNFPQPLTSWGQFRDIFGNFTAYSFLAYAVFGFFLNGGERCYVVRVAHETARPATGNFHDARTAPLMRISGINAGAWGKDLLVTVEDRATGDMILTELASNIVVGQHTVYLQSVAGLVDEASVGAAQADTITLIHKQDSFIREAHRIQQIDFAAQTIRLT